MEIHLERISITRKNFGQKFAHCFIYHCFIICHLSKKINRNCQKNRSHQLLRKFTRKIYLHVDLNLDRANSISLIKSHKNVSTQLNYKKVAVDSKKIQLPWNFLNEHSFHSKTSVQNNIFNFTSLIYFINQFIISSNLRQKLAVERAVKHTVKQVKGISTCFFSSFSVLTMFLGKWMTHQAIRLLASQ